MGNSSTSGAGGSHGGHPGISSSGGGMQSGGKGEIYNVKTDDILFIFTGAFVGLHRTIMDRIGRGSMGFGAPVRASNADQSMNDTTLSGNIGHLHKHLPFPVTEASKTSSPSALSEKSLNVLDFAMPTDLQKYGLIPELTGRIPITCALSSLDKEDLVRVLTEPRNSLLHQYEHLLALSGIELRFTSGALREIAHIAFSMGTGARGLRTVMEQLLSDAMFECPGSSTKYILITSAVVQQKQGPIYMNREQKATFQDLIIAEEEAWEAEQQEKTPSSESSRTLPGLEAARSFEEYRQRPLTAEAG
jgi:ATP-dependent Clp protease ATP-binding subunit ClpX